MFERGGPIVLLLSLSLAGFAPAKARTATDSPPVSLANPPLTPDSGSLAVRCGTLIDGVADRPFKDVTVIIRDGRIVSVQRTLQVTGKLPRLELADYTCLPGLIDMHTHLTDRADDTRDLSLYFRRSADEQARISSRHASATLTAGFTTVRYLRRLDRSRPARRHQRRSGRGPAHANLRLLPHHPPRRR